MLFHLKPLNLLIFDLYKKKVILIWAKSGIYHRSDDASGLSLCMQLRLKQFLFVVLLALSFVYGLRLVGVGASN